MRRCRMCTFFDLEDFGLHFSSFVTAAGASGRPGHEPDNISVAAGATGFIRETNYMWRKRGGYDEPDAIGTNS